MTKWTWPRSLVLKIRRRADGGAVPDLIVYLVIRSRSKGDLWFGPFVTADDGSVVLSGEALDLNQA